MAIRVGQAAQTYRIKKLYTAAIEAPSVSVCIPARNEMHAMSQCLESVLASDYKKLEIVVYDDSSADDTSILVKSFAHAGVRFVPGGDLPDGWLGRNHAFDVLAREASGTYLVFLDVDTLIKPTTISQLVGYMMTENVTMASVLPARTDTGRASTLFGHLRYFWEIVLARTAAPATSSALWMIRRRELLDQLGGFAPHHDEVRPEAHIAAMLGSSQYHCLIATKTLGVTYEKRWSSQVETSRRLLLPMLGGAWYGALGGVVVLALLNIPSLALLSGLIVGWGAVQTLSLVLLIAGMLVYGLYLSRMWYSRQWLGALLWPYSIMQELILFVSSVLGYARHTITWKGRSVTASPARVDHLEIDN